MLPEKLPLELQHIVKGDAPGKTMSMDEAKIDLRLWRSTVFNRIAQPEFLKLRDLIIASIDGSCGLQSS